MFCFPALVPVSPTEQCSLGDGGLALLVPELWRKEQAGDLSPIPSLHAARLSWIKYLVKKVLAYGSGFYLIFDFHLYIC